MARPRTIRPGVHLPDVLEKDWDSQLFGTKRGLCRSLGWNLCYHVLRSRGSQPGFPDRVLVRERIIYAELKRELTGNKSEDANRRATERQVEWLDALARAGAEVYVVRPSHLEEFGRVLAHRGRPDWVPSCAWRPDLWPAGDCDCWPWPGAKTGDGYGNDEGRPAHRVTYETFRGPIPDGFDLHHLCGNRACVNPWHLTALGHSVHASLDSANGRKEFCTQQHPFDDENTYVDPKGHRHCRTCRRDVNRRWRARESS